jgi:vacuolar-type H+-ATPase subunit H
MKNTVKLTESDLNRIVKKVLKEQDEEQTNYMFFSNLEQIKRQCEMMLEMDPNKLDEIIQDGHDWADDHISEAKNSIDQVFDFFKNEMSKEYIDYEDINEGRKKTGTKLCARGKASAKAKFKVYPSAYSNGHAVQVCQGKIKGLDGKKHCSGAYC